MQIHGLAHLHGPQPINAPHNARLHGAQNARPAHAASDQLDISDAGRIASELSHVSDIRFERVAQVRAAIAEGAYETPAKLELAVERMLDEIA